jgi:hypothetical protein
MGEGMGPVSRDMREEVRGLKSKDFRGFYKGLSTPLQLKERLHCIYMPKFSTLVVRLFCWSQTDVDLFFSLVGFFSFSFLGWIDCDDIIITLYAIVSTPFGDFRPMAMYMYNLHVSITFGRTCQRKEFYAMSKR